VSATEPLRDLIFDPAVSVQTEVFVKPFLVKVSVVVRDESEAPAIASVPLVQLDDQLRGSPADALGVSLKVTETEVGIEPMATGVGVTAEMEKR
jgi:hypothetical protein